jgi:quinol-cytochrome oxidoreductase complex cytochrome b subunit
MNITTKLRALIEVRKIIALMFAVLFAVMTYQGKINPETALTVILMVIGYYFGKSTALDKPSE